MHRLFDTTKKNENIVCILCVLYTKM